MKRERSRFWRRPPEPWRIGCVIELFHNCALSFTRLRTNSHAMLLPPPGAPEWDGADAKGCLVRIKLLMGVAIVSLCAGNAWAQSGVPAAETEDTNRDVVVIIGQGETRQVQTLTDAT